MGRVCVMGKFCGRILPDAAPGGFGAGGEWSKEEGQ